MNPRTPPSAIHLILASAAIAATATATLAADPGRAAEHREVNPVFAALVPGERHSGAPAAERHEGAGTPQLQLPTPRMSDGLTADQQRAVLAAVGGSRYRVDDLLRASVMAPHVLRMDRQPIGDGDALLQRVSVFFAGQGDLDAISDRSFLDALVEAGDDEEGKSQELSDSELRSAGIEVPPRNPDHDFVHRIQTTIFDRIRLEGVSRTFWSRSQDSIVVAMFIDPRFAQVEGLQPTWERFERREDGTMASAEVGRFAGAGLYIKITQLHEPEQRLFTEAHLALIEPRAWFGGANLLGSKIPPAIQAKVRGVRRQAARATANSRPDNASRYP